MMRSGGHTVVSIGRASSCAGADSSSTANRGGTVLPVSGRDPELLHGDELPST